MAGIPLDKAELLALFLEAMVYGVFATCYVGTFSMIRARTRSTKPHYPMIVVMTAMLIVATAHLIIDVIRIMEAFVGATENSAISYYADLSKPTMVAKTLVFVFQTMLGDGFFVYRVYIVWKRNILVTLLPGLSLLGTLLAGCGVVNALRKLTPGEEVFTSSLVPWITSYFSLTLSTNVISTSLIAGRIWWLGHRMSSFGVSTISTRGSSAVNIVIESGAIISGGVLSLLVVYLMGSNGQYPMIDLLTPLMGVIFCTIIIRVSMGYGFEESGRGQQGASSGGWRPPRSGITSHAGTDFDLHPVTVSVSKYVQRHTDAEESDMNTRYSGEDAKGHI